jgi:hypothetical protein
MNQQALFEAWLKIWMRSLPLFNPWYIPPKK